MNVIASNIVNNKPWSGLGAKIDPRDSLETALEKAELDWTAKRTQVLFNVDNNLKLGSSQVLYRSDNCFQLGIVTDKYNIVQPSEVIQGYRDLAALKNWPLEYMGILDGGRRIWALARTDRTTGIKDSEMTTYLLLTTTYDGSSGTIGKFMNLSKDCTSISLAVADNLAYAKFSVNHKTVFDADKLSQKLNLIDKAGKNFDEYVNVLAKKKLSGAQVGRFLIDHFEGKNVEVDKLSSRQANILKGLVENFDSHTETSMRGTALGLVKTIAQHVDYNVGRNVNNRMRAAWFGLGDKLKVDSFNNLLKMA